VLPLSLLSQARFVPLAALCAVVSLLSGIVNKRFATAFVGIIAGILTVVGFTVSPSLWLLTGLAMAAH
jgi:hypothetical protein